MSGIVGGKNHRGSGLIANLGSDGEVLTSAGAGLRQVFEAAGGGAWTFISTVVASTSASITVTGISATYDTYVILLSDMEWGNTTSGRCKWGNASTIDSGNYNFNTTNNSSDTNTPTCSGTDSALYVQIGRDHSTLTGERWGATIYLHFPSDASGNTVISGTYAGAFSATICEGGVFFGEKDVIETVDRFKLYQETGNIASGRMSLYGIAHA